MLSLQGPISRPAHLNVLPAPAVVTLDTPRQLWFVCDNPGCGRQLYIREAERNLKVCPRCEHHGRLAARERIHQIVDTGSFRESDANLTSVDPLRFAAAGQQYRAKLRDTQRRTGLRDAAVAGSATIQSLPVELVVLDFTFMGGSMGGVVGEKIVRAVDRAVAGRSPLVTISASGGARMHEGIFALMQMARTAVALGRLGDAGVPHFSVLTDPTLGGVTASFAGLGDVIVAEQGALVGFAGPRVIEQITKKKLPPDAQRAARLLENGMVDMVVSRRELRRTLVQLLRCYRSQSSAFVPSMAARSAHARNP